MKQVAPFPSVVRVALSARVLFFFSGTFGRHIMGLVVFVVAASGPTGLRPMMHSTLWFAS